MQAEWVTDPEVVSAAILFLGKVVAIVGAIMGFLISAVIALVVYAAKEFKAGIRETVDIFAENLRQLTGDVKTLSKDFEHLRGEHDSLTCQKAK